MNEKVKGQLGVNIFFFVEMVFFFRMIFFVGGAQLTLFFLVAVNTRNYRSKHFIFLGFVFAQIFFFKFNVCGQPSCPLCLDILCLGKRENIIKR